MFARLTAAMAITAVFAVAPAYADAVADFYKGKQIDLVVGYGPSGGYDNYARLLARHIGKFIPGNPSVIVQNMPGAGSLRALNYLYNDAPKDGTTIGTFSRNMPLVGLLGGNPNVQFKPRKLTWLGSSSSFVNDAYILIVRKDAPVKSIEEARRSDLPALVRMLNDLQPDLDLSMTTNWTAPVHWRPRTSRSRSGRKRVLHVSAIRRPTFVLRHERSSAARALRSPSSIPGASVSSTKCVAPLMRWRHGSPRGASNAMRPGARILRR